MGEIFGIKTELIDCPECNADPYTQVWKCADEEYAYSISCRNKGCKRFYGLYNSDAQTVINKWNEDISIDCPFCGKEVVFIEGKEGSHGRTIKGNCKGCGMGFSPSFFGEGQSFYDCLKYLRKTFKVQRNSNDR